MVKAETTLPKKKPRLERTTVSVRVTSYFSNLTSTFKIGSQDAKKVKMTQTKLFTKSDIKAFKKGKRPGARPTRFSLEFVIPASEVEKYVRKAKRLAKRNGGA
jgi:hypothetical protein